MLDDSEGHVPAAEWLPNFYDCLHELAARTLKGQRGVLTLQPTALLHEAYIRLLNSSVVVEEEAHFMALAARAMRCVLVDHVRTRLSQKRGGGWQRVALDSAADWKVVNGVKQIDLLALDEALDRLEELNSKAARVVEMLFFGGLSIDESADLMEVSPSTVDVYWRFAKAWLSRELGAENAK